jgi:hypothetical protein
MVAFFLKEMIACSLFLFSLPSVHSLLRPVCKARRYRSVTEADPVTGDVVRVMMMVMTNWTRCLLREELVTSGLRGAEPD